MRKAISVHDNLIITVVGESSSMVVHVDVLVPRVGLRRVLGRTDHRIDLIRNTSLKHHMVSDMLYRPRRTRAVATCERTSRGTVHLDKARTLA